MRTLRVASLAIGAALYLASPPAAFAQAPPSSPNRDAYYDFLMARHLEAIGDPKGALAALNKAVADDPRSAEVYAELAAFHLRRDEDDAAETSGKQALALDAE